MKSISVAVHYLSRFARTQLQVRRYLQRKGFTPTEISEAIDYLQEHKFLNDDAYAESYIESRIRRLDGPLKIKQLLMQKGIQSSTAQALLQEHYPLDLQIQNAKTLVKKRARSKDQIRRFIASRGYPGYVIKAAMSNE